MDVLPGDDPVKRRGACPDRGQIDPQEPEGLGVDDVEAAASVHEDLGEPDIADDGVDNERIFPQARHAVARITNWITRKRKSSCPARNTAAGERAWISMWLRPRRIPGRCWS